MSATIDTESDKESGTITWGSMARVRYKNIKTSPDFKVKSSFRTYTLLGHMVRARHLKTDTDMAVKVFEPALCRTQVVRNKMATADSRDEELKTMCILTESSVRHPCLMTLLVIDKESDDPLLSTGIATLRCGTVYAAMPFYEGSNYMTYLISSTPTPPVDVVAVHFVGIAYALHTLHAAGRCHLDMSLENVLLTSDSKWPGGFRPILSDYGASSYIGAHPEPDVLPGRRSFIAPEVYARRAYDSAAADVYSLGVCLYCMLAVHRPYEAPTHSDACFRVRNQFGTRYVVTRWKLDGRFSDDAFDLVEKMMSVDSDKRPSLDDVLGHPFCASVKGVPPGVRTT